MGQEFDITPRARPPGRDQVPAHRSPRCRTRIRCRRWRLRRFEPQSMRGQPPLVWDRAEDIFVYDKYGNRWLDWSQRRAGGQCRPRRAGNPPAIIDQVNSGLLAQLRLSQRGTAPTGRMPGAAGPARAGQSLLPDHRLGGHRMRPQAGPRARPSPRRPKKIGLVGAERGFHGRTLGAQQAGGMPGQKYWIVNEDPAIVHVPFPDGYWTDRHAASTCSWRRSASKGLPAGERRGRHV